jgi:hypothetical protein
MKLSKPSGSQSLKSSVDAQQAGAKPGRLVQNGAEWPTISFNREFWFFEPICTFAKV